MTDRSVNVVIDCTVFSLTAEKEGQRHKVSTDHTKERRDHKAAEHIPFDCSRFPFECISFECFQSFVYPRDEA